MGRMTPWPSWLRHATVNRKIVSSILTGVAGGLLAIFTDLGNIHYSFPRDLCLVDRMVEAMIYTTISSI